MDSRPRLHTMKFKSRYSICIILLLVTLVAIGLTRVVSEFRNSRSEHAIAMNLQKHGARIQFVKHPIPGFPPLVIAVSLENRELLPSQLASMGRLSTLTSLSLNGSVLSDRCIDELRQFDRVNFLYLCDTNLTDKDLRRLAILPRIMAIHVSGTTVSSECAIEFMEQVGAFVYLE